MSNHSKELIRKTKEIEAVMTSVLDHIDASITILDPNGRYLYVNHLIPSPIKGNVIGQPIFNYLSDDLAQQVKAYINVVIRTGKSVTYQNDFTGPDGIKRYYKHIMSPVKMKEWSVQAITIITTEITELKTTMFILEQHQHKLEKQKKQLEDFCHIVAHNLRGPLSTLLGLNYMVSQSNAVEEKLQYILMEKKVLDTLEETFSELVSAIQVRSVNSVQRRFVKLENSTLTAMKLLQRDILAKQAKMKYDFSKADTIRFPKKYLDSIMLNLISNALKYCSPDRPPKIHIRSYLKNGWTFLEVKDNGLGIDIKRYRDKLFKLHKTFHPHPNAKGFGLFITKTQIESMGGNINVKSIPGKGTTFIIQLYENQ